MRHYEPAQVWDFVTHAYCEPPFGAALWLEAETGALASSRFVSPISKSNATPQT